MSSSLKSFFPDAALPERWHELSPLLQKAIDRCNGLATLDQVLTSIMRGEAQYWPGANSVLVTEIVDYPLAKCLRLSLIGGVMAECWQLHDKAVAYARSKGCTQAEIFGRPGWIREMGPDWVFSGVILRREL